MLKTTTKSTTAGASRSANTSPKSCDKTSANGTPQSDTKIGAVIRRLGEEGGASLDDLVTATGWQPHTTRAALTGLRKKGHTIAKNTVDGVTRYSIAPATGA